MPANEPEPETASSGGIVCISVEVGTFAIKALDHIGLLETSGGWAKISYFCTYGGTPVWFDTV